MPRDDDRGLSRRRFLQGLAASAAAMVPACTRPSATGRRPNVLLIMSDEHNAGVLGCYGNEVIETPNLDGLARQGVVFDACYCNSPLCAPSRLSFLSGRYVSQVSAWNNQSWLASEHPALPEILAQGGYEAYLCGKMHLDRNRRYGFTELGESRNRRTKDGRGARRAPDDLTPVPGLSGRFDDFRTAPDSRVLQHDRGVTADVQKFLSERSGESDPFFLAVGYIAPHFPLVAPEEYWKIYEGRVPMPVVPDGHVASQPRNYRHLRAHYGMEQVPDEVVRRGRELYYGLTHVLDEEVGKVLQALAESPLAEDTIVIYTSDHGENLGEHGLWWKKCMYDSATRVPLIVSWPSRWPGGQRRQGACSLVDLTATLVDAAGLDAPPQWNGASLLPWLDGADHGWRDLAISEYFGGGVTSAYTMIRTGDYKYVYHVAPDAEHPPERELYDMKRDPGEFTNLALGSGEEDRIVRLHQALLAQLGEEPADADARCLKDIARGYPRSP